jgi:4-amino-4-deoxy-L-arabinose transferase-like glycosyltransferase
MANIVETYTVVPPPDSSGGHQNKENSALWSRIALGAIALISIFMNFFQLGQNGYGNLYYAAGVRSMGDSLHNFFFVSFDPGGFVTIDKPPLGFWLQVISTKIFGFTAFSIFFPQAVCGVLAVILLYYLVRRHFGIIAGLLAALVLALSPISVVTNRNNTIDGTLALALLLAAWAVIHAAETGKLRWLLLSALFVGIGFNIKMSEAYLVVPALGLTYLLCAPRHIWTRVWHLALALLVMLLISLSWAAAVDLTPVAQHPYVGSTQNNSEISLAFGYNGLNRLHIGNTGPGRAGGGRGTTGNTTNNTRSSSSQNGNTGSGTTSGNSGNSQNVANQLEEALGAGFRAGAGSPLALFSSSMGGQIGWLIPFALLAIVALAWQRRFHFQKDRQQLGLILWGFWLLTMAIFFTLDGSFHQYYMTEMAPGLSAMVGIGLVIMWQDYRNTGWRGWLLPIALLITAAVQINILSGYPTWSQWLSPLIGVLTVLTVIALLVFRLRPHFTFNASIVRIAGAVVAAGLITLLIAPTIWASYSIIQNVESSDPTAGPNLQANDGFGGFGGGGQRTNANRAGTSGRNQTTQYGTNNLFAGFQGGGNGQTDPALISYLEAHQGNTKFLVATPSSSSADTIILSTNKPVMAMGGFGGSDPILTTSDLQNLIHNGTVRFFLINSPRATQQALNQIPEQFRDRFSGRGGGFGGFGGFGQSSALSTWISGHCTQVPSNNWHTSTGSTNTGLNGTQLYDCASAS